MLWVTYKLQQKISVRLFMYQVWHELDDCLFELPQAPLLAPVR